MSKISIRSWIIIDALALMTWFTIGFINYHHYSYPAMDTWCYFSPVAFATHPFDLTTPLLGQFAGSNSGWGIHFPGGQLLLSLFVPFLPKAPALFVIVHLLIWLAAAIQVALIIKRLTKDILLAHLGAGLLLTDRAAGGAVIFQRTDLIGAVLALGAIQFLLGGTGHRHRLIAACCCLFLLPIVGPISVFAGAAIVVWMALNAWILKKGWPEAAAGFLSYAAGLLALFLYFWLQPEAAATFLDHAKRNLQINRENEVVWLLNTVRNQAVYAPFYIATLAQILGWGLLVAAALKILRNLRSHLGETWTAEGPVLLVGGCFFAGWFSMQNTYNAQYLIGISPFSAILAPVALGAIFSRFRFREVFRYVTVAVVLLLSSAYLAARTARWFTEGAKNYRAEIASFYEALPRQGKILIPEALWENALSDTNHTVLLNSLPYNSLPERQEAYQEYLAKNHGDFDYIVIDRFQSHPSLFFESEADHLVPLRSAALTRQSRLGEFGFDLTLYQSTKSPTRKQH